MILWILIVAISSVVDAHIDPLTSFNDEYHQMSTAVSDKIVGVPPFKYRNHLGFIAEEEKMKIGAELGVQRGIFAQEILDRWTSAKEYHLIDLWTHQDNYVDSANVKQEIQNKFMNEALQRLQVFDGRTAIKVCRNYTVVCVKNYPNEYFDFIYVDARHDYKGVSIDIEDWWRKLKVGGIMAGHDYVHQMDGPQQTLQNWTKNFDGTYTSSGRAVKGAIDDFAARYSLQVTISYRERSFNTWAIRKGLGVGI